MPASPLSSTDIDSRLRSLDGWELERGEIVRTFTFRTFCGSLDFVVLVGGLAEAAGHHPDIDIRYNKVRLALATHDVGGLTDKDFDLAGKIDELDKA